ncbi:thioredoxin family protein [Sungkyunkwania multivorans]|uniref:Thioredoxin family protein n=1 Tax=Sungkyunkwania multivorans TaxID=1173618 RepID=A0ABW3D1P4_9FLAO
MERKFLLTLLLILIGLHTKAQLKTYSFEEVEELMVSAPKTMIVFIHTDWCKYCKAMQKSTFSNTEVIRQLNENFYFVSFDAESRAPVRFQNRTFDYVPNGPNSGLHDLAWHLGEIDGQIAYPTLSVLNSNFEIIFQYDSFIRPKKMLRLLDRLQ